MGLINHGTQEATYNYFESATSLNFNKRMKQKLNPGIYSGGYLTRVNDTEVTLSTMFLEIGDGMSQISVETSTVISVTNLTLDGGTLSSATPYLVLRWAYVATAANYFEIRTVASVAAAQANDVIVGKVNFSGSTITGFDYTDRTPIDIMSSYLKVEPTAETELYVMLRGGRYQSSSALVAIPAQKIGPFAAPTPPNSRIDLLYLTSLGVPTIFQGNQAVNPVAPNYGNKLVLAEILVSNGATNIIASDITDTRAFILPGSTGSDGVSVKADGNGDLSVGNIFGAWQSRSNNTVYLATTDGMVQAMSSSAGVNVRLLTDGSNPPASVKQQMSQSTNAPSLSGITGLVRKGDYWKVENCQTVWWLPIGS
jgi:hypothetical protein